MYEQSGMTVEQMSDILNNSRQMRIQKEYELREENNMLKKKNDELRDEQLEILKDLRYLDSEKNKKMSEIVSLKEEIERLQSYEKDSIYVNCEEYKKYDLSKEFFVDLAHIPAKSQIIKQVELSDLHIVDSIDVDGKKEKLQIIFCLERKDNRVTIEFEEDYNRFLENENYLKMNPCIQASDLELGLNYFLGELKKLGKTRKNGKILELIIDPIKAAKYLNINTYVYIDEDFNKKNQDFVDEVIQKGVERERIFIEYQGSKQTYKIISNQILKEGDLIVIPSVDIMGKDYTDIFDFIIDMFYKQANILVEDTLLNYNDITKSDIIHILYKLKSLIELKQNKEPKVASKTSNTKQNVEKTKTKKNTKTTKKVTTKDETEELNNTSSENEEEDENLKGLV